MAISGGNKILAADCNATGYVTSTTTGTNLTSVSGTISYKRIGQLMIVTFNGCKIPSTLSYGQAIQTLRTNSSGTPANSAVNARTAALASIHTGDGVARHLEIGTNSNAITAGNTGIPGNTAIYGSIVIPIAYND